MPRLDTITVLFRVSESSYKALYLNSLRGKIADVYQMQVEGTHIPAINDEDLPKEDGEIKVILS